MSSSTNNINPRPCVYGCGIQIYWNASVNDYWEVLTKKKHICPNRVNNKPTTTTTVAATKPTYNKKPWTSQQQPKPKMSIYSPVQLIRFRRSMIHCQIL